jgi:hypothetical protein
MARLRVPRVRLSRADDCGFPKAPMMRPAVLPCQDSRKGAIMKHDIDVPPVEDHEAKLERALIEEFLRTHGHALQNMDSLPEDARRQLLRDASIYAAGRLAEIEARAHYVKEIHQEH